MNFRFLISTFAVAVSLMTAGCFFDEGGSIRTSASEQSNTPDSKLPGAGPNVGQNASTQNGTRQPSATSPATRSTGTVYNNTRFELVTADDLVNQYVPVGQTLDNWQAMFALRRFPNMASTDEAIDNVTTMLQQQHPETQYKVVANDNGSRGIDFVIWNSDKTLTEYNVHIYTPNPDGSGVLGNMYLMRAYGSDGHQKLIETVVAGREQITTSIYRHKFPRFTFPSTNLR